MFLKVLGPNECAEVALSIRRRLGATVPEEAGDMRYKSVAELMHPKGLKCLISLYPNPVSILSVPIQTVR